MTSKDLFVELLHRLQHYADAMVLHGMLQERADEREFESTRPRFSRRQMDGMVTEVAVRRSLDRLQARGLITVRVHANTRTHVAVNRRAVFQLLRQPTGASLPGRVDHTFPFLSAWNAEVSTASETECANPDAAMPAATWSALKAPSSAS